MKKTLVMAFLAAGLGTGLLAAETKVYPRISMVAPSSSRIEVPRDSYVMLVVEGAYFSHEGKPIPADQVVEFVNTLLKVQGASQIGVHVREGVRYGDVVRALDTLRETAADRVGVSLVDLPTGRTL